MVPDRVNYNPTGALDGGSHSFDNGAYKRPNSQMSNYQKKSVQKNSMIAAAN